MDQSLSRLAERTVKMMVSSLLLSCIWAFASGSVQVMHRKVQSVRAGGNVTFSCQSVTEEDVLQVTWQKETDGAEDNIATYSMMNGQKIAKGYVGHVSFAHRELQASAISLHGVTLQDEGCYKCIFNTFPSGALTGRMCLKVYAISDPKVEAKLIPSPGKAKDSEKVVGMSCSATGKPAPKITWHLPSILQQKPREYHVQLGNQTVTVISNFTHTYSKILQEYPITCEIQHPSLNVTLVLPTDSLLQGPDSQDSSVAPAIVIAVGVLVPLTSLLLLVCLLHCCLRHRRDPDRNPVWPCWLVKEATSRTHLNQNGALEEEPVSLRKAQAAAELLLVVPMQGMKDVSWRWGYTKRGGIVSENSAQFYAEGTSSSSWAMPRGCTLSSDEGFGGEKAMGGNVICVFNGHHASRSKLENTGKGCEGKTSVSHTERHKDLFGNTNSQDLYPHTSNIQTFGRRKNPNNLSSVRSFLPIARPRSVSSTELRAGRHQQRPPSPGTPLNA